jgi:hypothetical protein
MPALVDDFAELKSDPTMGMRPRLLGADRVESRQGQDTEEFDPLAAADATLAGDVDVLASNASAATRCDPRSNGAWRIFVSDKHGF